MAAKKRNRTTPAASTVTLEKADVRAAIAALDAAEQFLELVRGPLNGGDEMFIDDLVSAFQDRVIVAARIRLARALNARGNIKARR